MRARQHSTSRVRIALASVTLLFAAGLASEALAQGGKARARGVVTDAAGEPIAGVKVTAHNDAFSPSTFTAETDERGGWAIIGFGARTASWTFTFEREGFVTYETAETVRPTARNVRVDVSLEPATATGAAGVGEALNEVDSPELYREGVTAFESGDYATARDKWVEFLSANPGVVPAWLRLAEAHVRLDDETSARAAYQRVEQLEPDNPTALFMLGAMSADASELDAAVAYFERVIAQDPDNPSLYYNVGEIYFQRGQAESAVDYYARAVAADPDYAPAYKQLGFAHVNGGDMPAAIAAFERFLELEPADTQDAATVTDILSAIREAQ